MIDNSTREATISKLNKAIADIESSGVINAVGARDILQKSFPELEKEDAAYTEARKYHESITADIESHATGIANQIGIVTQLGNIRDSYTETSYV